MIEVFCVVAPEGSRLEVGSEVIAVLPPQVARPNPAQSAQIYATWLNGGCQLLDHADVLACLVAKGLYRHIH